MNLQFVDITKLPIIVLNYNFVIVFVQPNIIYSIFLNHCLSFFGR